MVSARNTKGHVNLLVLTTPYDETIVSQKTLNKLSLSGLYWKRFIPGRLPNSYLITEKAYEPYVYHTSFGNKPAIEIRGTWEVQGDFMAGPFTIHHQRQSQQSKYYIRRFVFAPSTAKRDYIFEVETILRSIKEKK
ncbi:MAG: hypothetical protein CM15mP83_1390 [Flavobacteriaceae bacterium]|nr:MAG: hypothetical protein CM15mP83_1390 [Flavobacteriaceae bacterium]